MLFWGCCQLCSGINPDSEFRKLFLGWCSNPSQPFTKYHTCHSISRASSVICFITFSKFLINKFTLTSQVNKVLIESLWYTWLQMIDFQPYNIPTLWIFEATIFQVGVFLFFCFMPLLFSIDWSCEWQWKRTFAVLVWYLELQLILRTQLVLVTETNTQSIWAIYTFTACGKSIFWSRSSYNNKIFYKSSILQGPNSVSLRGKIYCRLQIYPLKEYIKIEELDNIFFMILLGPWRLKILKNFK